MSAAVGLSMTYDDLVYELSGVSQHLSAINDTWSECLVLAEKEIAVPLDLAWLSLERLERARGELFMNVARGCTDRAWKDGSGHWLGQAQSWFATELPIDQSWLDDPWKQKRKGLASSLATVASGIPATAISPETPHWLEEARAWLDASRALLTELEVRKRPFATAQGQSGQLVIRKLRIASPMELSLAVPGGLAAAAAIPAVAILKKVLADPESVGGWLPRALAAWWNGKAELENARSEAIIAAEKRKALELAVTEDAKAGLHAASQRLVYAAREIHLLDALGNEID